MILNLFNIADLKKILFSAGVPENFSDKVIFEKNVNAEFRLGQNGFQIADLLFVKIHFYFRQVTSFDKFRVTRILNIAIVANQ